MPTGPSVQGLSRTFRILPRSTEILTLGTFIWILGYSVYAFRLFPSHDWWNSYGILHYVISSLLDGTIPYWSPAAACGSPLFYTFIQLGMLDPAFLLAVAAGKVLSLNVLAICFLWFVLRMVPFVFGMFWLVKQHTRHSAASLAATIPASAILFLCLLRDSTEFCVYWPLMLASFLHFRRTLTTGNPSWMSFHASVALFGVSLLLYNPAYTLVFTGTLAACVAVLSRSDFLRFLRLLPRIPLLHWATAGLLGLALVLPAAASLHAQDRGSHFVYVRAHQAFFYGRPLSALASEPIEYFQVDPERSPRREPREAITCIFPFYYTLEHRAEGTMYFGALAFLGVWAGACFLRKKAFWAYFSCALFFVFLMSPGANSFIRFFGPLLPFLKILNQRHLLYPAFLVPMTVAGGMGLALLAESRSVARILPRLAPWRVALAGTALLAGCLAAAWLNGPRDSGAAFQQIYGGDAKWLHILFLEIAVLAAWLVRTSSGRPKRYKLYVAFLTAVGALDLMFVCPDILAGRRIYASNTENNPPLRYLSNEGVLSRSRWVRDPQRLAYVPFRSPLLPRIASSQVTSIASLTGFPCALPAYWHCDVMYSMERYYELFSQLDVERLRPLLSITTPILRTCERWRELNPGEDAIALLKGMTPQECAQTVLLEQPGSAPTPGTLARRAFSGPAVARRNLNLPPVPDARFIRESAYPEFFDQRISLPVDRLEETCQGTYHNRLARLPFDPPDHDPLEGTGTLPLLFPDYPFAIDVQGEPHYVSGDGKTLIRHVPGTGLLLEWEGSSTPPSLPTEVYFQKSRLPAASDPTIVSYSPNRVEMKVFPPGPAVVLFSDLYDKNWHVSVDGRAEPLWVANHAFKAVRVTGGRQHTVVFEYRVPWLDRSLWLYGAAVALAIALAIRACWSGCFARVSSRLSPLSAN